MHWAGDELAAVAASNPERSRDACERLNAGRAATAEEIVHADDIDVVHVCTPNHLHRDVVLAALAAGKHVVCEKPLTTSLADTRELAEAAARTARVTAVPFVYRSYASVREARERIGQISPWLMHGGYLQDFKALAQAGGWRSDPARAGVSLTFGDIGSHWCDLMEFVTGQRITSVNAAQASTGPENRQDGVIVLFHTDHNAVGSLIVSQSSPGRKNKLYFSFDGRANSVMFDQEHPDELVIGGLRANTVVIRDAGALSPAAARYSVLPGGHPQGYQDCFNLFMADVYQAVRTGQVPDGLPTFVDGLRAAQIDAAVSASIASGDWVQVPEMTPAGSSKAAR
ncbi:Gfo/Idh/MocA family protein [Mycobacterium sp. 1164966.3]|uniref:Gfo/Idh/MocA family protein n=1 Tax=Mycobacterium sp. 1164966.3 TaxID=1856861 RepID=UPI000B1DD688|nr:Gfo/Idh/MocA family oxidoreductase [Mycobacterium sp. 1164966.3]